MMPRSSFFSGISSLALALAIQPALAQEPVPAAPDQAAALACGPWLGGTETDLSTAPAPLQEQIASNGPQTRGFRLTTPQTVRIEARTNTDGDPWVRLYDATANELGYNDDTEHSLNASYETQLEPGDYCVTVADASQEYDLTLQVGRGDQTPLLGDKVLSCLPDTDAQPLAQGPLDQALAQGAVSAQADASRNTYFRMTLAAPAALSLRATAEGEVDPQVALFDAAGQMLASNDDADGRNARLDFSPNLQAGEYCIGVGSVSDAPGAIRLAAQKLDPAEYLRQSHARGEVPPVGDSYPVAPLNFAGERGEIVLQGGSANWFRFQLDQRAVVAIHTMGSVSSVDTKLALFDDSGRLIQENDDTDSSRDAKIAPVVLQPGGYMLALTDAGAGGQVGTPLRPVVLLAEKFLRVSE